MGINLLIVDDHPVILNSLKVLAEQMNKFELIHTSQDVPSLHTLLEINPDLALIDLDLGGSDGRDLMGVLHERFPKCKSIFFSSHGDASIIQNTLQRGAQAYLLKTSSPSEIRECIQLVLDGQLYIGGEVQTILNEYMLKRSRSSDPFIPSLTSRELEVLRSISQEKTSREIAADLYISENTVEGHRARLFQKLQVKNVAGLIRKAFISGLLKD